MAKTLSVSLGTSDTTRCGGRRKKSSRPRSSNTRNAIALPLSSPATMRAIGVKAPGGPEMMELAEVPDPKPGEVDLRVRVRGRGRKRAARADGTGHCPP